MPCPLALISRAHIRLCRFSQVSKINKQVKKKIPKEKDKGGVGGGGGGGGGGEGGGRKWGERIEKEGCRWLRELGRH